MENGVDCHGRKPVLLYSLLRYDLRNAACGQNTGCSNHTSYGLLTVMKTIEDFIIYLPHGIQQDAYF
ncbi:hypothetical protein EB241_00400 [Erwinia psidii]|uniref:Uncharacterized protein n=1 Tax=Erwinia psidii TaxID=69224 RepID=A0A3N6V3Y3_9GAMM|nr:hypothetical protein EB241_00400 [Erwinia psidii]